MGRGGPGWDGTEKEWRVEWDWVGMGRELREREMQVNIEIGRRDEEVRERCNTKRLVSHIQSVFLFNLLA